MSSKPTSVAPNPSTNVSFSGNDSEIEISKDFADKIWENGISLDGEDAIQCKFCDDVITGGLHRFHDVLIGTENGGDACAVDDEKGCTCVGVGEKRKGDDLSDGGSEDVFKKMKDGSEGKTKEILREEPCEAIARFFYDNAIPLKVAESKEFIAMCEAISRLGIEYEPPSVEEISGKYLTDNVRLMNEALEEHRCVWKKEGCSIVVDGWTDKKRVILNLFENSSKGTFFLKSVNASDMLESPEKLFKMMDDIVEEVGEEDVVQVVTDVTPYFKAAGEMLMGKRTRLYWTPCATHCIDMMLSDYEKKIPIYEEIITKGIKITTFIYSRDSLISLLHKFTEGIDLVRRGITRCVTSYLTLGGLYENKEALKRMFTSKEWKSSQFAKTSIGKYVEDVVLDQEFWKNVMICLGGANPLVDVLRLVNSIDKPATGFIYEAMEQAKEEIRKNLSKDGVESFMPLWEIIDERWHKQLHTPLHAAGYFLNPQIHYSPRFRDDINVKADLQRCITRIVADPGERAMIKIQLDDFHKRASVLGYPLAVMNCGKEIPSDWWKFFGNELPELQKFACRVLSLTCSSYAGLHNQSAFKMVHAKKRNLLRQKTRDDVIFVMSNSKLAEKNQARGSVELNLDVNRDDEGLDMDHMDFGTPHMKSLHDMISDLHDHYDIGDGDGDEDGDQKEDSD